MYIASAALVLAFCPDYSWIVQWEHHDRRGRTDCTTVSSEGVKGRYHCIPRSQSRIIALFYDVRHCKHFTSLQYPSLSFSSINASSAVLYLSISTSPPLPNILIPLPLLHIAVHLQINASPWRRPPWLLASQRDQHRPTINQQHSLHMQGRTYNLASLPELNDVDNLFTSHNWESQSSNYLRPSRVPEGVNDMTKDVWMIFCQVGREEEIGKRKVRGDWSYPVCC